MLAVFLVLGTGLLIIGASAAIDRLGVRPRGRHRHALPGAAAPGREVAIVGGLFGGERPSAWLEVQLFTLAVAGGYWLLIAHFAQGRSWPRSGLDGAICGVGWSIFVNVRRVLRARRGQGSRHDERTEAEPPASL